MHMKTNNLVVDNSPLFFLFTCVKEGRPFINKLFDSLLSQTKINFVHYIYEDGPNDSIGDLVESYKKKVEKLQNPYQVIYEHNPVNIGLTSATQHCIEMCNSKYFIWIDCDNWVDKDFFKELEKEVLKHDDSRIIRTRCISSSGVSLNGEGFTFRNRFKKNQLKYFLYNSFCYGFFAVDFEWFKQINPSLYFLKKRDYFIDDQVIFTAMLHNGKFAFSDSAIGIYLEHDSNESILFRAKNPQGEYNNYSETAHFFGNKLELPLKHFYSVRVKFENMSRMAIINNKEAWRLYFERIEDFKKYKIPHNLRYKFGGNSFSWFVRLLFSKILYVLRKGKKQSGK